MRRSLILLWTAFMLGGASSAMAGGDEQEWIFPIVVNGGQSGFQYQTTFSFRNLSTTAGEVLVRGVPDDSGAGGVLFCPLPINILPPSDTRLTSQSLIAGNGAVRIVSSGDTPALFTGWVRATTLLRDSVEPAAEISIFNGPPPPCDASGSEPTPPVDVGERPSTSIISSIQVPGVRPALEFAVETTVTEFRETGFAIVNPNEEPAEVIFDLLDAEGLPIVYTGFRTRSCPNRFTLEPGERRVALAQTLAPHPTPIVISFPCEGGLPDNFQGTARIVADRPIAVGALHVLFPEGKIVNAKVTGR